MPATTCCAVPYLLQQHTDTEMIKTLFELGNTANVCLNKLVMSRANNWNLVRSVTCASLSYHATEETLRGKVLVLVVVVRSPWRLLEKVCSGRV